MAVLSKQWDARYFQMAFQVIFLSYGLLFLHWSADWINYIVFISTGLLLQWICDSVLAKKMLSSFHWISGSWKSSLISCLSLCLLLKVNHPGICVFTGAVTVLSKYLFRYQGKHIFNPSALGIVAAVYFTGNAWISPGQWGNNMVLFFAIICLGLIVVTRVQKLDISLAFLSTYAALLFARQILYLGWPLDFFVQSISTGSLLLFSFFMISDPRTTPNHPVARISWAIGIATIAFYLTAFKLINGAPIWVLVLAQPLVPLLDYLFKAKRFEWYSIPRQKWKIKPASIN
jgi:Na+-transporting NADH:ubiquinone oxidoreductase subunit NqrB